MCSTPCAGGGENSTYFVARGCEVTGVDISEQQCALYAQRFPGQRVLCRSVLDTGFDHESFDLVITESPSTIFTHASMTVCERSTMNSAPADL